MVRFYSENQDSQRARAKYGEPGNLFSLVSTKLVIEPESETIHDCECLDGPNIYGVPIAEAFLHEGRETPLHWRVRWALSHDEEEEGLHTYMRTLNRTIWNYLSCGQAGEYLILPPGKYKNILGNVVNFKEELHLTFEKCALDYIASKAQTLKKVE